MRPRPRHHRYDWRGFDVTGYQVLSNPTVGDMSYLTPKFVAFKGPLADDYAGREVA